MLFKPSKSLTFELGCVINNEGRKAMHKKVQTV